MPRIASSRIMQHRMDESSDVDTSGPPADAADGFPANHWSGSML